MKPFLYYQFALTLINPKKCTIKTITLHIYMSAYMYKQNNASVPYLSEL